MKREEAENLYREMQETKRHNEEELRNKLKDKRVNHSCSRWPSSSCLQNFRVTSYCCNETKNGSPTALEAPSAN